MQRRIFSKFKTNPAKIAGFYAFNDHSGIKSASTQFAGAMGAAGRLDRHGGAAEGAVLVRRIGRRFLGFLLQPVHAFDQQEYRESDDQEADHAVDEETGIQGYGPGLFGGHHGSVGAGSRSLLEGEEDV